MADRYSSAVGMAFLMIALAAIGGCRPGPVEEQEDKAPSAPEDQPVNRVIFPADREVDDPAVNRLMHDALNACASGDYESFRLLWSARQEPLRREEFEQGWRAVQTIRIRAIERILIHTDKAPPRSTEGKTNADDASIGEQDISYVLLAEAEFDPNHPVGQREPQRDIVLLVTREQGQWRLGRAPPRVRNWLKERAGREPFEYESGLVAPRDRR